MKFLFIFLSLFVSSLLFSQAPEGINYQAVMRNSSGNLVTNSTVAIRVQIRQGSSTGTTVYQERHSIMSSSQGLINMVIGAGMPQTIGTFNNINWAVGPFFVNLGVDFSNGVIYQDFGTQQLMSVPYALYAKTSGAQLNQWRYGNTVPVNSLGVLGDFYLDVVTGNVYYKNSATTWVLTGNIKGPVGPSGAQGIQGIVGAQGIQGLTGSQGIQGATGAAGTNGTNGTNGQNTLVKTTTEAAGANCTTGGVKIEYGLDANNNGTLDLSEINATLTKYVCNGAVGATGSQGPIGLTGAQGPIGLTGPQGPTGLTGPIGLTGSQGPIGLTGAQGPIGLTGPQGPTGLTGSVGAIGPQGPIGLTGAVGATGPIGLTGSQGPIGLTGAQGPIGLTGPQGPTGLTGSVGAIGPQGPIGLTGAQGPIGLTGAVGATGPIGLTGSQGPIGLTGAQGPIGLTGPQGPTGLTGSVGAIGPQGPIGLTGAQGPIGLTGAVGATGPQGTIGLTGAVGATGAQGIAGTNGNDGATGAQGPIGLTGAVGATGVQGPIGLTGAVGATGPQGSNGLTALIKTTTEPSGANCATGGTKIETGLDVNNNGLLDIAEVNAAQTTYVCNGGLGTNSGNGIYSGNSIISNDTVSPLMRYIGNGQEGAFDCTIFNGELSGEHFYTNFKVSSNCTLQIGKAQTTIIHVKDTCFINGVINGNGGVVTRYTEDRTNFIGATGDYSYCPMGGGQSGYYYTYDWSFSPEGLSQLIGHNHIKSTGQRWSQHGMSLNDIRIASFLGTRIHGCTSNMINCGNMAEGGSGLVIICKVLVFSGQILLNGTQGNAGASGGGSLIISADNILSNIGSFSSSAGSFNGSGGQGIKYIINY